MKKNKHEFLKNIKNENNFAILLPETADKEIVCAGLGLYNFLLQNKKTTHLISKRSINQNLSFLPNFDKIKNSFDFKRDLILSFDLNDNKIKNINWEQIDNKLNIFITPEKEISNNNDLSIKQGSFQFDFLIILGANELNNIGDLFKENPEIFWQVPIINIDNQIDNEHYGQINLIDLKTSGISELITDILLEKKLRINPDIANCLFAGILESTDSFKTPKTSPKTLNLAAKLIGLGANQKEIVKNLYKANDIKTIKQWGKIMATMDYDKDARLCYTRIDPESLNDKNFDINKIKTIFEKIQSTYNKKDTLLLLWSKNEKTQGLIQNSNKELLKEITGGIDWGKSVFFETQKNIHQAIEYIAKQLKESQE